MFNPPTLEAAVANQMTRSMWLSQELLGYDWAEHYEEDFAVTILQMETAVDMLDIEGDPDWRRKLKEAANHSREELRKQGYGRQSHGSFLGRLLRRRR